MYHPRNRHVWRLLRPLAPLGAIAATALLAGCEDEETPPGLSTGGAAGATAGSGGTAGKGGSSGAGNGGTAGTAGQGGTAGGGNGGTAGQGGTAGGGNGGTAGQGGTAGGGNGGTAGAAGGTTCGDETGDGTTGTVTSVATGGTEFISPFDATPSPDGCTVYFTAIDPTTGAGAVFSVAKDGTGLKRLDEGGLLQAPVGLAVSTDGATLYIADTGFGDATTDAGAVLSLAAAGGTPAVVIAGNAPRTVSVAREGTTDQLYFGGSNASGAATVFKAAAGSNTATEVAAVGGEVGGIAVASDGSLLVVSPDSSSLLQGTGTLTALVGGLKVGLAGGVAVSTDGTSALVAAADPAGTSASGLVRVVIADKSVSFTTVGAGLVEPSGLHRAGNVEVYAFVDGLGSNGSGSVWVAEK